MKRMLKKNSIGTNSSKGSGLTGLPISSGPSSKGGTRPSSGTKKASGNRIPQSNSAQGHYDSSSQ
jgi:hypothetical protein